MQEIKYRLEWTKPGKLIIDAYEAQAKQLQAERDLNSKFAKQNTELHERLEAQAKELERLKEQAEYFRENRGEFYWEVKQENEQLRKELQGIGVEDYYTLKRKYHDEKAAHNAHVTELIESEKKLKEAAEILKWYGNQDNHTKETNEYVGLTEIDLDNGTRAREFLSHIQGKGQGKENNDVHGAQG